MIKTRAIAVIDTDEYPEDPINDIEGCLSIFALKHPNYKLGHKHAKYYELLDIEGIEIQYGKLAVYKPVYLYDNSGISLQRTRICQWDSGFIGWQFITEKDLLAEFQKDKLEPSDIDKAVQILDAEFDSYNTYVSGKVLEYTVYLVIGDSEVLDKRPTVTDYPTRTITSSEIVDSCGGFYEKNYCYERAMKACVRAEKEFILQNGEKLNEVVKAGEY
jgi:hypothetical protein